MERDRCSSNRAAVRELTERTSGVVPRVDVAARTS